MAGTRDCRRRRRHVPRLLKIESNAIVVMQHDAMRYVHSLLSCNELNYTHRSCAPMGAVRPHEQFMLCVLLRRGHMTHDSIYNTANSSCSRSIMYIDVCMAAPDPARLDRTKSAARTIYAGIWHHRTQTHACAMHDRRACHACTD